MAVTIADVARRAGVANGTVSRALNGYSDILPETKRRVMEAAKELGYVPNVSARNLSAKRPPNMALIMYGLLEGSAKDNLGYLLLQGVLAYTTEHHLELAIYMLDLAQERQMSYTEFCRLHSISGAIVSGVTIDDPYLMELISSDIPSVAVDLPINSEKAGWVSIDNRAAAKEATQKLLALGHRDLLIIAGKKNADVNTVRMQGVQDALEGAGMCLGECERLHCDFSEEIAYQKTLTYLKTGKKTPTAIFCFSDIMALGVMRALGERGLRIPQDVSLLGFDGLHLCELTVPPLSTVAQDRREIGYEAAAMLHELMQGRCEGGHRLLPHEMILRESVRDVHS